MLNHHLKRLQRSIMKRKYVLLLVLLSVIILSSIYIQATQNVLNSGTSEDVNYTIIDVTNEQMTNISYDLNYELYGNSMLVNSYSDSYSFDSMTVERSSERENTLIPIDGRKYVLTNNTLLFRGESQQIPNSSQTSIYPAKIRKLGNISIVEKNDSYVATTTSDKLLVENDYRGYIYNNNITRQRVVISQNDYRIERYKIKQRELTTFYNFSY